MVHLIEWATGSELFLTFDPFLVISRELVVHLIEWATGSKLFLAFEPFLVISRELVVYLPEWATSSIQKPCTVYQCRAF